MPYSDITYTIAGNEVGSKIISGSLVIDEVLTSQPSTCSFTVRDPSVEPLEGNEIVIESGSTKLFAGIITKGNGYFIKGNVREYQISAQDYEAVLQNRRVAAVYTSQTCKAIIEDIITNYVHADWGFTTVNVVTGPTLTDIQFDYMTVAECIRKICSETGYSFYVDYDKDIHFFLTASSAAPKDITDNESFYWGLSLQPDFTQVKNMETVIGGTFQSPPYSQPFAGDDVTTSFDLTYRPHSIQADEDGTAKTVGVVNLHDPALFDYMMNYNDKTIERQAGGLPSGVTLTVTYTYDVRVIVTVDNAAAQTTCAALEGHGDGIHEDVVRDESITSNDEATRKGQSDVNSYGTPVVKGSFRTYEDGFKCGQEIVVNRTGERFNGTYIIKHISMQSKGGGLFEYTIEMNERQQEVADLLVELFRRTEKSTASETGIDTVSYLSDEVDIDDSLSVVEKDISSDPDRWDFFDWGFGTWN